MDEREIIRRLADLKASPSLQADSRILAAAEGALKRSARRPLWAVALTCPTARWTAAAVLTIGVALAAWSSAVIVSRWGRPPAPSAVTAVPVEANPQPVPATVDVPQPINELALAAERLNSKDVSGLIELLDTGEDQTKIAVAGYLADLNASQALPGLQQLASRWTGDPNANPFSQAAARIRGAVPEPNRLPAAQSRGQAVGPAAPGRQTLKIMVVDALTGQGLAGTRLSGRVSEEGPWIRDRWLCDANGTCEIELAGATFCHVQTSPRSGYVARQVRLSGLVGQLLAQGYALRLDRAVQIGGVVQDPNGSPVTGAKVSVDVEDRTGSPSNSGICLEFEQQTDAGGRWLCDTTPDPASLTADHVLHVTVQHPVYCRQYIPVNDPSTLNALLSLTHLTLLDKGGVMRGRVVNEQGEPIAGASVDSYNTDVNGVFVIRDLNPNGDFVRLSVRAKGYPTLWRQIDYQPGMADVEIVLYRPGTVDVDSLPRNKGWFAWGRITDAAGASVAGAEVTAREGGRCFTTTLTDSMGRYILGPLPVPIAIMNIQVYARDFQTFRILEKPVFGPMDFAPNKGVHVSGKVTDRQTGRPLDQFRIVDSIVDEDGKIRPLLPANEGKAGRYECTLSRPGVSGYVIAIEADGYLPAATRVIGSDEQDPVIDLALARGTGPSGVVLDANGVAVTDAWVYEIPENKYAWWWHTQPSPYDQALMSPWYPWVRTAPDGGFSMQPTYQLRWLVAMARQGICSVTCEPGEVKRMVLLPWAKVRGVVHNTNGTPALYQAVEMISVPQTEAEAGYQWILLGVKTDDRGAFQIDWLPPGRFTLLGKTYEVKPGQTLNLDLILNP
jgi:hypothetical protein